MTNGDYIRSMPDEALAEFLTGLWEDHDNRILSRLQSLDPPVDVTLVEFPTIVNAVHLKWLKQQMEEDEYVQ